MIISNQLLIITPVLLAQQEDMQESRRESGSLPPVSLPIHSGKVGTLLKIIIKINDDDDEMMMSLLCFCLSSFCVFVTLIKGLKSQ